MADYICGPCLVMIGQKLRPVSQKMWQFHLNMNIEGTLWRHAVTSLVTSSLWKSFWWMIYILSFYTCCQIEAILKTAKFFKLTKIWGPGELFHHKCHRKYVILTHWGRDKMAAVFQTTLSNAFSWMKMLQLRLKFHWNLSLRVKLTIFQHWFR